MILPLPPHILEFLKRFRIGLIVAILSALAASMFLYYSETGELLSFSTGWDLIPVCIAISIIMMIALYTINDLLNKWLSWNESAAARFLLGLLANLIVAFAIVSLSAWLYASIVFNLTPEELFDSHSTLISKLIVLTVLAVVTYTVIDFALYSYKHFNYTHVEKARTQRKYLELQFELLKSQLSPHYLFNCLNTISSLVFKDSGLAEDFIRRLAATYQYILTNSKKKHVTLKEEIEFVKSYNYLLQVRFENLLKIEINLPSSIMDSRIPPITLQMLVENAVKHNIISKDEPLTIYISAIDNQSLRVINNQTRTPDGVSSFHVGLDNIKKRYQYLTKAPVMVSHKDDYCVTLPVIRVKPEVA